MPQHEMMARVQELLDRMPAEETKEEEEEKVDLSHAALLDRIKEL